MSFNARVFRILIASPSDVAEERELAVGAIQTWNDLNSPERQVVLLPLRWETHSSPEYGQRPQEIINRQVVDYSDLLIGIFWTRMGSPTGVAESGTVEEIERIAKLGKPIMLYFSQVKQDPDLIDPEQLKLLREFKKMTFPKALVETYSTPIEFRDKLQKQLDLQIRKLIAEESQVDDPARKASPSTDILLEFADVATGNRVGPEIQTKSDFITVDDTTKIPDYGDASTEKVDDESDQITSSFKLWATNLSTISVNKAYYREMVAYLVRRQFFRPFRLWLKNIGSIGARDVYVDIRVSSETGKLLVVRSARSALLNPPSKSLTSVSTGWYKDGSNLSEPEQVGSDWTTTFEIRALQPQREVRLVEPIFIGAEQTSVVTVTGRIYADTLPEPATRILKIHWTVDAVHKKASELLRDAGIEVVPPRTSTGTEKGNE